MAGNTVVVKPSKLSVLAPSMTIQTIAEMFPPGVINIVTGDAAEIGDSLSGSVDFGYPLTDGADTERYDPRVHFSVTAGF